MDDELLEDAEALGEHLFNKAKAGISVTREEARDAALVIQNLVHEVRNPEGAEYEYKVSRVLWGVREGLGQWSDDLEGVKKIVADNRRHAQHHNATTEYYVIRRRKAGPVEEVGF